MSEFYPVSFRFYACLNDFSTINRRQQTLKKEAIEEQLEPLTKEHYHEFYQCTECYQVYRKGSYYPKLQNFIQKVGELSNSFNPS